MITNDNSISSGLAPLNPDEGVPTKDSSSGDLGDVRSRIVKISTENIKVTSIDTEHEEGLIGKEFVVLKTQGDKIETALASVSSMPLPIAMKKIQDSPLSVEKDKDEISEEESSPSVQEKREKFIESPIDDGPEESPGVKDKEIQFSSENEEDSFATKSEEPDDELNSLDESESEVTSQQATLATDAQQASSSEEQATHQEEILSNIKGEAIAAGQQATAAEEQAAHQQEVATKTSSEISVQSEETEQAINEFSDIIDREAASKNFNPEDVEELASDFRTEYRKNDDGKPITKEKINAAFDRALVNAERRGIHTQDGRRLSLAELNDFRREVRKSFSEYYTIRFSNKKEDEPKETKPTIPRLEKGVRDQPKVEQPLRPLSTRDITVIDFDKKKAEFMAKLILNQERTREERAKTEKNEKFFQLQHDIILKERAREELKKIMLKADNHKSKLSHFMLRNRFEFIIS